MGCINLPMRTRLILLALLLVAATACKHNERARTTVRQRAAFDFPCPESALTLRVLDTEGARDLASQIAVQGCGQKAVYVYYPDTNTWFLDGVVAPVSIDDEAQPKEQGAPDAPEQPTAGD
jgi:hypothetical protein